MAASSTRKRTRRDGDGNEIAGTSTGQADVAERPRRRRARGRREERPVEANGDGPAGLGPVNALSGGSAVLASVSVIWIAAQARWTFGLADGLFWGSVVAFVVLRAVATRLTRNAHGPQAASAWARTALVVGAAAVALWLGAKSIQSRTIEANAHDYSSGGAQRV